MSSALHYRLAADAMLLLHSLFVAFVVLGLLLVFAGAWRGWRWVQRPAWRFCHLAAVAYVVVQAWLGKVCPLTTWEMALRVRAGEASYSGAFIAHWLENLLYYRAPDWVFVAVYTVFGALVLASWLLLPPRRNTGSEEA
ncbi:MAG: DUF2784 domain-containing protein [Halioglobus sp.]|nr:DUF2784 domain-containing protein [Halioglobus sp.]